MLGFSGNLINRATQSVSNATSAIRSAASDLRDKLTEERTTVDPDACSAEYIHQSAKFQVNLNVKSTPSKDAVVTSALAAKRLWAMKRNEQGVWNKKLLCTMPHMFLYYYDSETSDAPRGIIDLYYYTDYEVDDNVLILNAPGTSLNPFMFQFEDPSVMTELVSSLLRDRYNTLRDERDAYQGMQAQMSGELHNATEQIYQLEQEKARFEEDIAGMRARADLAMEHLTIALQSLGLTDEEEEKIVGIEATGNAVNAKINALKEQRHEMHTDYQHTLQAERAHFEEEFNRLQAEYSEQVAMRDTIIQAERTARNNVEIMKENEKMDSELKLRELLGHVDKLNLNLQMAFAAKSAEEDRCANLTEQKKVLIKEVKTLRKRDNASNETITELKELNEKLSAAVGTLQGQVKLLTARLQQSQAALAASATAHHHISSRSSSDDITGDSTLSANLLADVAAGSENEADVSVDVDVAMQLDLSSLKFDGSANRRSPALPGDSGKRIEIPEDAFDDDWQNQANDSNQGGTEGGGSDEGGAHDGRRPSWGIPGATLMELGWLSSEQRNLIAQRAGINPDTAPPPQPLDQNSGASSSGDGGVNAAAIGGSIINSIAATLFFANSSELPVQSSTSSNPQPAAASAGAGGSSSKRGSYFSMNMNPASLLSSSSASSTSSAATAEGGGSQPPSQPSKRSSFLGSMFSADKKTSAPVLTAEEVAKPNQAPKAVNFFDSPLPDYELPEDTPKDTKLRCLRCGGTVEGPKYSTCKCQIPALTPEALAASVPAPSSTPSSSTAGSVLSMFASAGSGTAAQAGASGGTPAGSSGRQLGMGKMLMPNLGPDPNGPSGPTSSITASFSSVLFGAAPAQPALSPAELLAKWDKDIHKRRVSTISANPNVSSSSSSSSSAPAPIPATTTGGGGSFSSSSSSTGVVVGSSTNENNEDDDKEEDEQEEGGSNSPIRNEGLFTNDKDIHIEEIRPFNGDKRRLDELDTTTEASESNAGRTDENVEVVPSGDGSDGNGDGEPSPLENGTSPGRNDESNNGNGNETNTHDANANN